jgi:MFS family permease
VNAAPAEVPAAGWRLGALALLALWIMAPVTLPVPVLRELVQERFAVSELLTSLFMSVNMVGALFAAPMVGALVDRIGRRRPLLVGALLLDAVCFFALAAPVPFPVFLSIRFVEGCAHIGALSILLTLASNTLAPERRGRAMGIVGGAMMLGIAIGAPVGGALAERSVVTPLEVGGLLLLGAALLAWIAARDVDRSEQRPSLAAIAGALRERPAILLPLAFAFADRFTVGFFTTTFSLYLRRIHDLTPPQIGISIAIFMIPFALLSVPFGLLADRRSPIAMLCVGSVLYGIGTAAVGFTAPPALFGLMFAIGVAAAVMFVPSMLMTMRMVPDGVRATALGAFNAAGSLGFVLGPITGGAVSQAVAASSGWLEGYRAAFIVAGASEILCVVAALVFLARQRMKGSGAAKDPRPVVD